MPKYQVRRGTHTITVEAVSHQEALSKGVGRNAADAVMHDVNANNEVVWELIFGFMFTREVPVNKTWTVRRKSSDGIIGEVEGHTYYQGMQAVSKMLCMNYNECNRLYYLEEVVDEEADTRVVPCLDDLIDEGEVSYFGKPLDEDFAS